MNTEPSIAVVIPAYNAAEYINSTISNLCLNECVKQIIVVDDCSTDNTRELVEAYRLKDERVSLVRLEQNRGAGVARNIAIQHVTEEYCFFLDADDEVVERGLDKAVGVLHAMGGDFIVCKWFYTDMDGKYDRMVMNEPDEKAWEIALKGKKMLQANVHECPFLLRTLNFPWHKIYRTSFLCTKKIRFSETLIHNDNLAHWMSYALASSFIVYDYYLTGHKEDSRRKQISTIMDVRRLQLFDAFRDIDKFFAHEVSSREIYQYFVCYKRDLIDYFGGLISQDYFQMFCDRTQRTLKSVTLEMLLKISMLDAQAALDIYELRSYPGGFWKK